MRVALVTSPTFALLGPRTTPYLPVGLLTVASMAEASGHDVDIVDINRLTTTGSISYRRRFYEDTARHILEGRPDMVGLTTMCHSYPQTLGIAEAIHRLRPEIPIVLGGPQATAVDESTVEAFPSVTAVVRGEAESSFLPLMDW